MRKHNKLTVKHPPNFESSKAHEGVFFFFASLFGGLVDERLVDMGDDATAGDGALDERVELLIPADG